ncbi:MAG: helix-turn-helix transcriptional regulator [Dysgonamonadaceae bacterium]|jgi:transcriptional regulator with XRE-family HTH domain|nr:helix-turn-helix transcriptional regulator [Dysgonamonadaceae bacterium]
MNEGTEFLSSVHHGRNIKRLREILGVKQDALAIEFNITQQAVSDLEKKAQLSDDILEKVAKVLNIPIDAIRNFNEEIAINIISNTFNDIFHDNSSFINYQPTFNQIDKLMELMERLLKTEQEKNTLLEKMLAEKK